MTYPANYPTISTNEVIRPTYVEIDLKAIKENFALIKKHVAPARVMPILKANAYGHGLVRIAKLMQELKADCLGVAVLEEGILLREMGIKIPILVLGGILGNQIPLFLKHDLMITASSIEKLSQIDKFAGEMRTRANVHLKIDTGMERIGVHYYSADKFLEAAINSKNINVVGIFSHFANSEKSDLSYSNLQLERFLEVLDFFPKRDIPTPTRHISNSAGILQLPDANLDMVRPGIMMFGIYPSDETHKSIEVKPALKWKSHVVYFKVIKPGHPVGYGSSWETDHQVRAVTVPVGYGDGYLRSMTDKAHVIIRNKKYPVVGTISMDQIVVNIEQDSAYNGDEVILLGIGDGCSVRCEELAEWAGTIPYEILTNINTRVPRIYSD